MSIDYRKPNWLQDADEKAGIDQPKAVGIISGDPGDEHQPKDPMPVYPEATKIEVRTYDATLEERKVAALERIAAVLERAYPLPFTPFPSTQPTTVPGTVPWTPVNLYPWGGTTCSLPSTVCSECGK